MGCQLPSVIKSYYLCSVLLRIFFIIYVYIIVRNLKHENHHIPHWFRFIQECLLQLPERQCEGSSALRLILENGRTLGSAIMSARVLYMSISWYSLKKKCAKCAASLFLCVVYVFVFCVLYCMYYFVFCVLCVCSLYFRISSIK